MHNCTIQSRLRACLAGLLSGSGSSRGALPNVFVEKSFLSKKQRSWSRFSEATNYGFSKMVLAPLEEPLVRSPAKQALRSVKWNLVQYCSY